MRTISDDTSDDLRLLDTSCDDYLLSLLASASAAVYQHKPTRCERRNVARQLTAILGSTSHAHT